MYVGEHAPTKPSFQCTTMALPEMQVKCYIASYILYNTSLYHNIEFMIVI